ncbi:MAG: TetR/AcrR family transcriptional regulator [Bacteroidota bacterium]
MVGIIKIDVNENLYLRNPEETELGKLIISEGLLLISELGFEHFTFKKLATKIESTEASIYRYFENKHHLLLYFISYYWGYIEFLISFETNNIKSNKEKLKIIIDIVTRKHKDNIYTYLNEEVLHAVIVAESPKSYLTKEVDSDNKYGFFVQYKRVNKIIADLILEINPKYKYANSLSVTIIETSQEQEFFQNHLPSLCSISDNKKNKEELKDFIIHFAFACIEK